VDDEFCGRVETSGTNRATIHQVYKAVAILRIQGQQEMTSQDRLR
jgi:hypothetical protein